MTPIVFCSMCVHRLPRLLLPSVIITLCVVLIPGCDEDEFEGFSPGDEGQDPEEDVDGEISRDSGEEEEDREDTEETEIEPTDGTEQVSQQQAPSPQQSSPQQTPPPPITKGKKQGKGKAGKGVQQYSVQQTGPIRLSPSPPHQHQEPMVQGQPPGEHIFLDDGSAQQLCQHADAESTHSSATFTLYLGDHQGTYTTEGVSSFLFSEKRLTNRGHALYAFLASKWQILTPHPTLLISSTIDTNYYSNLFIDEDAGVAYVQSTRRLSYTESAPPSHPVPFAQIYPLDLTSEDGILSADKSRTIDRALSQISAASQHLGLVHLPRIHSVLDLSVYRGCIANIRYISGDARIQPLTTVLVLPWQVELLITQEQP